MKRVVVLGAGPCGMAAAWEFGGHDMELTLIGKEEQVGGLGRIFEHKGFRFDVGGHRFITASNGLLERACELMEAGLVSSTRQSIILLRGRQFQYPLSITDILSKLNLKLVFVYHIEPTEKGKFKWVHCEIL